MSDHVLPIDHGLGRLVNQPDGGFTGKFPEDEFLGLEGAVS